MRSNRRPSRDRLVVLAVAAVGVLAVYNNVVVTRLPGGSASYVPTNVAATGLALGAARWAGLQWRELGLGRGELRRGLAWGAACAGLVTVGYGLALALPAVRPLLGDDRYAGLTGSGVAFHALVRVPFGTVLWEEVAFRGVLLGALLRLLPVRAAVAVSAAVFGAWHVRPALGGLRTNELADGSVLVLLTGGAVVGTAAAGVLFCWLRLRTGSLVAPMMLHLATNSLGASAVWLAR